MVTQNVINNSTESDLSIAPGNLLIENTDTGATTGQIIQGGSRTFSNFGTNNIFVGPGSGNTTVTGTDNSSLGFNALTNISGGSSNTAMGSSSLGTNSNGNENVSIGKDALSSGDVNNCTCIGFSAGLSYTGGESDNICIGHKVTGTIGESGITRIGDTTQNSCFITGIVGAVVVGTPVLVSAGNQLGIMVSSIKYKENIKPLSSENIDIIKLNPVSFNYKSDKDKTRSYGLIAEEVEEVAPQLVVYENDKPKTVKYNDVYILMLDHIKKQQIQIDDLISRISDLEEK